MIKIIKLKDWHSPPLDAQQKVARIRKTYAAGEAIQKTIILRQERPK